MLVQSSIENYLSIKGKIASSLLSNRDNEHPKHLIADGNKNYPKSAATYGANVSRKSNVLNALWFMVNYVLTSHDQQLHKTIAYSPPKFGPETPAHPGSFEIIFIIEGVRYTYGFSVIDRAVTEECLYYCPNGRQAFIFERKNTKDFCFTVDAGEQNTPRGHISVNKFYLSVASNWGHAKVTPILKWFASCQIITKNSVADVYGIETEQLKDGDYRCIIASILRVVDLGIQAL